MDTERWEAADWDEFVASLSPETTVEVRHRPSTEFVQSLVVIHPPTPDTPKWGATLFKAPDFNPAEFREGIAAFTRAGKTLTYKGLC
jgi:hypothetical protein